MRETWYVLEDGNALDPNEVVTDEAGQMKSKDGIAVAMRSPGVPSTRGVDVEEAGGEPKADPAPAKAPASARQAEAEKPAATAKNREMKAGSGSKRYKTR